MTADLSGRGYQDVIVPTTNGIDIFDGQSGTLLTALAGGYAFQSSPLVTDDPNGHIGITGTGYVDQGGTAVGAVLHWEVNGTAGSGSSVHEAGG